MEIIIILIFILLNGFFSMSEIAVVSSRKSKLDAFAKEGNKNAKKILRIKESPDNFLSTIQIAITTIGLIIGLYTGEQYVGKLAQVFERLNIESTYSAIISRVIIVVAETFIMLILGELVPKRIGMTNPERVASFIVKPLAFLSKLAFPFVWLLSKTTNLIFSLLGYKRKDSDNATEEEIRSIIQESASAGEIDDKEQKIVNRVFDLDDRGIVSLMTPRADLEWFEKNDKVSFVMQRLAKGVHYIYPVVDKSLDNIVGVIYIKDVIKEFANGDTTLENLIQEPNFLHESVGVYDVLEIFKKTKIHYAFIIDEFGIVQGMVTMNDILEALIDNSSALQDADENPDFVKQSDGSFVVDGQYSFYDFLSHFNMKEKFSEYDYDTLSGLILSQTGKLPKVNEEIHWENLTIRIIRMEGARIDKVLVIENK
ncbi:MAG: hemolysin family protein [Bacteroidota bacterium]|nr:hemolysin family protein [Bacteroidota bacterium]